MPESETLKESLAQLALADPREARLRLRRVLDSDAIVSQQLLEDIGGPGDTRLRHLVANVARSVERKERFIPFLVKWRDRETDEFTRRAIKVALADLDESALRATTLPSAPLQSQVPEIYEYVANRLRHRIRNAMLPLQTQYAKIDALIRSRSIDDAHGTLARMNDAMISLAHIVEATDVDPEYFKERQTPVLEWLKQMNADYAARFATIRLTVDQTDRGSLTIFASPYLLETIFWNIWMNAHQAVGIGCEISIIGHRSGDQVVLLVIDNGEGFPENTVGVVFSEPISTKDTVHRGRGLLEVQDAMRRLQGKASLVQHRFSEYRIRLSFPYYES